MFAKTKNIMVFFSTMTPTKCAIASPTKYETISKIHLIVAGVRLPIVHQLSSGSAADDPEGQKLMTKVPKKIRKGTPLIIDKAYEGDECRATAKRCGMRPVVPPKSHRVKP